MADIWDDLKTQSLARPLTAQEQAFATHLEAIFSQNIHDFDAVCAQLNHLEGVVHYTPAFLQDKLTALNADLDKAYQHNGRGAV
jgi:cAMP phosphodiesterase